ncbi:MAG TPA: hypothetical protein DEA50_11350, partial [Parvularcula sp.]|nr:hypothetical protein [Parvularcula sp.]
MTGSSLLLQVRAALKAVAAPAGGDLISCGAIEGLTAAADGAVRFALNTDRSGGGPEILEAARAAAAATPGVTRVSAVATAHRAAPAPARNPHENPLGLAAPSRIEAAAGQLAGVRRVIAVAMRAAGAAAS